jgi:hypothetical protein
MRSGSSIVGRATSWAIRARRAPSGEWLFRQPEIGENIDGKLPPLFDEVGFNDIRRLAYDMGYVTTFEMTRPGGS